MAAASQPGIDVIVFRAAGFTCAIRSSQVSELILMPELSRVAGQPAFLDGFFNLRGATIPVAALHTLLEKEAPAPGLYTPLIVLSASGRPLALRVDSVDELAVLEESALRPCAPLDSFNGCAEGQFEHSGRDIVLLAPERLLLAEEHMSIESLAARARQRLEALEELPG